jgi:hypothetical protein
MAKAKPWEALGKTIPFWSQDILNDEDADSALVYINHTVEHAHSSMQKWVDSQRKRCKSDAEKASLEKVVVRLNDELMSLIRARNNILKDCHLSDRKTKFAILNAFKVGVLSITLLDRRHEHSIFIGKTMKKQGSKLKETRKERWNISRTKLLTLCKKHHSVGCNQKELCQRIADGIKVVGAETVRDRLQEHKIRASEYKK